MLFHKEQSTSENLSGQNNSIRDTYVEGYVAIKRFYEFSLFTETLKSNDATGIILPSSSRSFLIYFLSAPRYVVETENGITQADFSGICWKHRETIIRLFSCRARRKLHRSSERKICSKLTGSKVLENGKSCKHCLRAGTFDVKYDSYFLNNDFLIFAIHKGFVTFENEHSSLRAIWMFWKSFSNMKIKYRPMQHRQCSHRKVKFEIILCMKRFRFL